MHSYVAYDLCIHSALPLPELLAGEGAADVTIRLGEVDRSSSEATPLRTCFRATAEEAGLFWEEAGAFLVRGGNEIVIDPAPGVEGHTLRLFLLGPALGLLLHQRGFLILHASAVAIEGQAVAFLGGPGWGKSTTAAALHARGHSLVVDDVLAVETGDLAPPIVFPGFPQLKLWPEAAASLGDIPEKMPRLHPRLEKRARRDARDFPQSPLPLRRVYVLAEGPRQEIEPIERGEAFVELVRHSYLVRLLQATGAAPLHFRQCERLVKTVPIRRLRTHRSLAELPALARMVEEEIAGA